MTLLVAVVEHHFVGDIDILAFINCFRLEADSSFNVCVNSIDISPSPHVDRQRINETESSCSVSLQQSMLTENSSLKYWWKLSVCNHSYSYSHDTQISREHKLALLNFHFHFYLLFLHLYFYLHVQNNLHCILFII